MRYFSLVRSKNLIYIYIPDAMSLHPDDFPRTVQVDHRPAFAFGVEEPRLRFVGRKKELNELKAALSCDTERLWLVAGPGGMGKSQLMKKFISQVKNETNCIWLLGESARSLSLSMTSLSIQMGFLHQERAGVPAGFLLTVIVANIRNSLNGRHWIFVIDNIDEKYSEAEEVVSTLLTLSNVKTFVTSRLRHIFGGTSIIIEVKPLSDEDAQTYVNESLPKQRSTKLVLDLCATLQNHPLALSQAVDYIRCAQLSSTNENYSIENYLKTFRSQSSKLLNHKVLDENTTVFHTCSISMKIIPKKHGKAGQVAISLLRRLAYFDPDGVPRPIFTQFLSERTFKSETLFEDGLALLKLFSLIWIEGEIITVHRLVQQVALIEIQNLWWPNQYIDQLFEVSSLLLRDKYPCSMPLMKQISFILQEVLKNESLNDTQLANYLGFPLTIVNFIVNSLKNNEVGTARERIEFLLAEVQCQTCLRSSRCVKESLASQILQTVLLQTMQVKGDPQKAEELAMRIDALFKEKLRDSMRSLMELQGRRRRRRFCVIL
jgi:hypothetical protein